MDETNSQKLAQHARSQYYTVVFRGRRFGYYPNTGNIYMHFLTYTVHKCVARDKDGYPIVKIDGVRYSLARIACIARDPSLDYDDRAWSAVRKNYIKEDLTGDNLYAVGLTVKNHHARFKRGRTGLRGVSTKNGKTFACHVAGNYLGTYRSKECAAKVYDYRVKQIAGNLANINLV